MNNILFELLLLHGNDTSFIKGTDTYYVFNELVVAVTKAVNNIRYCSRKGCLCHPETDIKQLLKDEDLVDFLDECAEGIVDDLLSLCEDYDPIVAKGIFEDE